MVLPLKEAEKWHVTPDNLLMLLMKPNMKYGQTWNHVDHANGRTKQHPEISDVLCKCILGIEYSAAMFEFWHCQIREMSK